MNNAEIISTNNANACADQDMINRLCDVQNNLARTISLAHCRVYAPNLENVGIGGALFLLMIGNKKIPVLSSPSFFYVIVLQSWYKLK